MRCVIACPLCFLMGNESCVLDSASVVIKWTIVGLTDVPTDRGRNSFCDSRMVACDMYGDVLE